MNKVCSALWPPSHFLHRFRALDTGLGCTLQRQRPHARRPSYFPYTLRVNGYSLLSYFLVRREVQARFVPTVFTAGARFCTCSRFHARTLLLTLIYEPPSSFRDFAMLIWDFAGEHHACQDIFVRTGTPHVPVYVTSRRREHKLSTQLLPRRMR